MSDEDKLSGLLDDELDAADAKRMEALVEADGQLAQRLARWRENDALLRRAFAEIPGDEVPERFLAAIGARGTESRPPEAGNDNSARWRIPVAMAASLALGIILGGQLLNRAQPPGFLPEVAAGLERVPSGQTLTLASGDRLTPELTFARQGGGWCRQFTVAGSGGRKAGLACRQRDWSVEALVPATEPAPEPGGYAVAEGEEHPGLEDVANSLRADDPLGPSEERKLLESGWRNRR